LFKSPIKSFVTVLPHKPTFCKDSTTEFIRAAIREKLERDSPELYRSVFKASKEKVLSSELI
jgi:hypothetical protein